MRDSNLARFLGHGVAPGDAFAKEEFCNLDSLGTPGDWAKFFATGT